MTCEVSSGVILTPIGPYDVSACNSGIHYVQLCPDVTDDNFLQKGQSEIGLQCLAKNQSLKQLEQWMREYFSHKKKKCFPDISICAEVVDEMNSNTFSNLILTTLKREVGFGETISYGELAKRAGKTSGAARAVGTVMANNKICLVIPCHRVIKSDGSEGNYAKATKNSIKKWLLEHEKMSVGK
jgi:O-6-methylguanine DNA methyltransferase